MADPIFVDNVTPLNAVNMNKLQTRDEKGVVNGYPSLDANGKIPISQIGGGGVDYIGTWNSGVTYKQGDVITYQGFQYLAVNPSTNVPPPTGYTTAVPPQPANPGDTGKWLQAQSGAMVWTAMVPTGQGARLGRATSVAAGNGALVAIPFTDVVFDTDACFNAGSPTLLTCKTAGVYVISATVFWSAVVATGEWVTSIQVNSLDIADQGVNNPPSSGSPRQSLTAIYKLAVNDAVRLTVYQNTGASQSVLGAADRTPTLAMVRVGP
jgi:hypothetical protein